MVNHLTKLVEAALFSAAQPLSLAELKALDPDLGPGELREAVDALREHYESHDHAFELVELADGFQLLTRREYAEAITQARMVSRPRKLSGPAMETLAIIAYRQPVTAEEVSQLRGSRSHALLNQLVRRGLLCLERPDGGTNETARQQPTYYTTERFNRLFGIDSPQDLPSSEDLDDK